MYEQLESELKIQQITIGDLVEEAHEYVKENIRLKDEVSALSSKTALSLPRGKSHFGCIEREGHQDLVSPKGPGREKVSTKWERWEISSLKARLQIMQYDSEMAVATRPFSAGIMDVACNEMLSELRSELADEKAEHSVTREYYRQVDDAYNQEAEEVAELMKQIQEKAENKMAGDSGEKSKDKTDPKDGKAWKSRSVSPVISPSKGPSGPPGPPSDDPPDPNEPPPGFPPSLRGSTYDDSMSQSNVTIADIPMVSRREAAKVTVGPWPKIQDVENWKSDVVKSVILAANDGDRAAWQEWILPAITDYPDLDALNDSGGSSFQSIDTKLSIALTNDPEPFQDSKA